MLVSEENLLHLLNLLPLKLYSIRRELHDPPPQEFAGEAYTGFVFKNNVMALEEREGSVEVYGGEQSR